jgi:hypothetical protein
MWWSVFIFSTTEHSFCKIIDFIVHGFRVRNVIHNIMSILLNMNANQSTSSCFFSFLD